MSGQNDTDLDGLRRDRRILTVLIVALLGTADLLSR